MTTRMRFWLVLPVVLLLAACSNGGSGGGLGGVPFAFEAYLKASNTGTTDNFGQTVAFDGDTLVIGVPDEDGSGAGVIAGSPDSATTGDGVIGSGAVYVFVRAGGLWSQQAYIKASNPEAGDAFGTSVAISGDTLVVGTTGEDSNAVGVNPLAPAQTNNSALDSGAVYVFLRSAGIWTQQAYIKASNTGAADNFGSSVAISGNTLVVGATGEDSIAVGINPGLAAEADNTASASGAVYVFTRSGITWSQQAYVKASNAASNDTFGASVAVSGDTLAVGTPGEDSSLTGVTAGSPNEAATLNGLPASGAVYVFTRSGPTWSQQAYVKASNTGGGDAFGTSVGIDGDTLVVGTIGEDSNAVGVNPGLIAEADNSANASGAVYVFARSASTWTQQAYVKASNTGADDQFGTSVSISGNILVVGAPGEDSNLTTVIQGSPNDLATGNGATNAGAVYTFINIGGVWSQQDYVKASNTDAFDVFGASVAVNGDTLVAGATGERSNSTGVGGNRADNSLPSAGAAYVFR